MQRYLIYSFEDVIRSAEEKLTASLGASCHIRLRNSLSIGAIQAIQRIESTAFRPELRYTTDELIERGLRKDFFLLLVHTRDRPVAFMYGYRDPVDLSFYLDTVATSIEGRGVGSTLIGLTLLHCLEAGFEDVTLRTEERDEKGRTLRRFYEKLGFGVYPHDPKEGIAMRKRIEWRDILTITERTLVEDRSRRSEVMVQSSFHLPSIQQQDQITLKPELLEPLRNQ